MKFCIECGHKIESDSAKFCPNCGKNLLMEIKDNTDNSSDGPDEDTSDSSRENSYSLGVKLEEIVEKILNQTGYIATRRQRLEGRSGVTHVINIVAHKDDEIMAVECKNCGEGKVVGIKELRDFDGKLRDLRGIKHSMYVTNTDFSSEAELYAKENNIDLWDGAKLSNMSFSMHIGRFNSRSINSEITIENALPVKMNYQNASRLDVANPTKARISKAELLFHPFHVFEYKIDLERIDRSGKNHRIRDEGIQIVDALTGKPIYETPNPIPDEKRNQLYLKGESDQLNTSDLVNEIVEDMTIEEISSIQSEYKYKIKQNEGYNIVISETRVPERAAKRMAIEEIVDDNTTEISYEMKDSKGQKVKRQMTIIPKLSEIRIWKYSLVYVPQWNIKFEAKGIIYNRIIMPASGTTIVDEIAMCPMHSSRWKVWSRPKQVYAVCDICGQAVCKEHIMQVNSVYVCVEHSKAKSS